MIKFKQVVSVLATAGLLSFGAAQAALIDRGGGLIYDDVQNITWMQDANYSGTLMNWSEANAWAADLVYGGYSDWRLPTVFNNVDISTFGGTNAGFNVAVDSSEFAHLYFVDLGNFSWFDTNGAFHSGSQGVDWGLVNRGPFINIQDDRYWFATESGNHPGGAWGFDVSRGSQGPLAQGNALYAWAVRDGDVAAIPEPETYAMLLAGLGVMGFAARRRKKSAV